MKKNIIYFMLLALIAAASGMPGCKKISSPVYSSVTPDNIFQTPAQINATLAQAYTPMTAMPFSSTWYLNEIPSDEFIVPTRGNDWYDGGKWQSMWLHTFIPTVDKINGAWSDLSNGIVKCNFVLNLLNGLPAASQPANTPQIVAEIKVLRAYYYLKFMDLYGNVPLVTDYNTPPTSAVQVNQATVYAFLETELTTNVPLLQDKSTANYGHMTKWGGYMVMAKLYMNAQVYTGTAQWTKAASAADMVIQSGKYSLQPNFFDNFIVANEGSVENIFAVPFDNTYIGGNSLVANSLNYNNIYTYNFTGQPNNGFCAPTAFYRSFTAADIRIKMWEVGQQYSAAGAALTDLATHLPVIISPYVLELSNPADTFKFAGARCLKYAPQPGTNGNAGNDGVIFRLADAYLMKAEAEIRSGTPGDALSLINKVRTRAGVPLWTASDLTLPNLLAERGRELAWEGWRRPDLIRYEIADGIPYFSGPRMPAKTQDPDKHTFFVSIPSAQLISNPKLVQNPGY